MSCEAPEFWISCITSHSSLGLYLMSSLLKRESIGTKLVELFVNRVVERRNMIKVYLRGELALRVLGRVDLVGLLILSFSCSFHDYAAFRVFCWSCGFSFF
jgi:hypothetical protein